MITIGYLIKISPQSPAENEIANTQERAPRPVPDKPKTNSLVVRLDGGRAAP